MAGDDIRLLDRFEIDHAVPNWATSRGLTAMVRMFNLQVVELIRERDRTIAEWTSSDAAAHVFEDRDLEITSFLEISSDDQMEQSVLPSATQPEPEFARGLVQTPILALQGSVFGPSHRIDASGSAVRRWLLEKSVEGFQVHAGIFSIVNAAAPLGLVLYSGRTRLLVGDRHLGSNSWGLLLCRADNRYG